MNAAVHRNLPILLGAVRQQARTGELALEQSDGVRRFWFDAGQLVALRSEAAGEQLGGWLLRQGVLDLAALNRLLADHARRRIGEKLVERGLLSIDARNAHLQALQEQILVRALEHPVLRWSWTAAGSNGSGHADPEFRLQDRHLIWRTLQDSRDLKGLVAILEAQPEWKWEGRRDLLDSLRDMPLTPSTAFAVSFFGAEPIGFDTFRYLSGLDPATAGRLIATLWAFGALVLASGRLPDLAKAPPPPGPPFGSPGPALDPMAEEPAPEDPGTPEFLDLEPDPLADPDSDLVRRIEALVDAPPCGPRPPGNLPAGSAEPLDPRAAAPEPWPEELPPCGPRPAAPLHMPEPSPRATQPPGKPLPAIPAPPPRIAFAEPAAPIELDPERKGIPPPPTAETLAAQAQAGRLLAQAQRQARLGRTIEAVRTLEQAVDLQPEGEIGYAAWLLLGRLRSNHPSWTERAIHAYQTAALLRPKEVEPLLALAELLRRSGAAADAEACLKRARELDPAARAAAAPRPARPS